MTRDGRDEAAPEQAMTGGPAGVAVLPVRYVQLLRDNRDFRLLWTGQVISQFGDWFSNIAVLTLLLDLTGSGLAAGWVIIARLIPHFLISPFAGAVADRFHRKRVMIVADLARAVVVLGLVGVRDAGQVWLVYVLVTVQVCLSAFFEPARNATIPNIVRRGQWLTANVLGGITWSIMLAVGSAIGGFVTAYLGRDWAFSIDAATFVVSAICIRGVHIPRTSSGASSSTFQQFTGLRDIWEGYRYLIHHPPVLMMVSIKALNGLSGGATLLLAVYADRVFHLGHTPAEGMGILYSALGIGALVGPILTRRWTGDRPPALIASIAPAFGLRAVFFWVLAYMSGIWSAAGAVLVGAMGGSVLWVFSTTLLQMAVPDRFRGRVFALEFGLLTVGMSASNYGVGYALDLLHMTPPEIAVVLGIILVPAGILWALLQSRQGTNLAAAAGRRP